MLSSSKLIERVSILFTITANFNKIYFKELIVKKT